MSRRALPLVLLLLACRGPEPLVVGAAASLSGVLPELVAAFHEANPDLSVTTTIGSSGQLAQQVRQGAPIGVFLSADAGWVDTLVTAGRVVPASRAVYARGRLAVWSRDPLPITAFEALPSLDGRIAIANPAFAPYGRAALEALAAAGILDRIEPRLVYAGNVRQALQYAETGNAAAAIVALSLVFDRDDRLLLPETLHTPLDQALGVVRGHERDGGRFADFVLGAAGRAILARHGFLADVP